MNIANDIKYDFVLKYKIVLSVQEVIQQHLKEKWTRLLGHTVETLELIQAAIRFCRGVKKLDHLIM